MEKLKKLYLVFENEKNNCWLDAALSLIVFNRTLKKIVKECSKSQIKDIIAKFEETIPILNNSDENIEDRISKTKTNLVKIQQSTLQYLQHFSNFKEGEPDSAFCALLNLILLDKSSIKEQLTADWSWIKQCTNCHNSSKYEPPMKPIITLPKVKSFEPECPTSFYTCSCKTEQEMKLTYKSLPPCFIFHFEKGAGNGENYPLIFTVNERKYHLTAVVVLEKSCDPNLNHFVTYIRVPSLNFWLDCNDLNTSIVSFSTQKPEFALKDVCMYIFEAFDDLGKIPNEESADTQFSAQHSVAENSNVEFIDLANEAEEVKQPLENEDKKEASKDVIKDESLLNSEGKFADYPSKSEYKEENNSICKVNLPLKKAIKERQLNINNNIIQTGHRFSTQKMENKNEIDSILQKSESCVIQEKNNESKNAEAKVCNVFGDKNVNASDESQNKDLKTLTGIPANKNSNQSFKRNADEQKSKFVDLNASRSKSDAYLSADALELIQAKKKAGLFGSSKHSPVRPTKKEECSSDIKSEKNSETTCFKNMLDQETKPVKNLAATQIKLEGEERDAISSNALIQKATTPASKNAINECIGTKQVLNKIDKPAKTLASNTETKLESEGRHTISSSGIEQKTKTSASKSSIDECIGTKQVLNKIDKPAKTLASNTEAKLESEGRHTISSSGIKQKTKTSASKSAVGESNQETSAVNTGMANLFASNSKCVHDEIKHTSSKAPMSVKAPADKHNNTLSKMSPVESESDSCEYDEQELVLKMKQTSLKVKKIKASASNKTSETVDTGKEASGSSGFTDTNDDLKSVRKSSRISSKPKKVVWNQSHEPKEVSPSPRPERRRRRPSHKKDNEESTEEKVRKIVDNVVERTFASFMEQLYLRQNPM